MARQFEVHSLTKSNGEIVVRQAHFIPGRKRSFKVFRVAPNRDPIKSIGRAVRFIEKRAEKYGQDRAGTIRFVDYSKYSGNAKDRRFVVNFQR